MGAAVSAGAANIDSDGTCNEATTKDIRQIWLGVLGSNGGPTQTIALDSQSVAIDSGDDGKCPKNDQRGVTRPQGAHCDVGAYEFQYTPTP